MMKGKLFEGTGDQDEIFWDFTPLRPLREDMTGEVVFTKRWQKLMGGARGVVYRWDQDNAIASSFHHPFINIVKQAGYPNARDARVATSLVCWLGTNVGTTFLEKADRLADAFAVDSLTASHQRANGYVAAWALENERHHLMNSSLTIRECLLSETLQEPGRRCGWRGAETMELTLRWLGGEAGQAFIAGCRRNIALKREREWAARRAHDALHPKRASVQGMLNQPAAPPAPKF